MKTIKKRKKLISKKVSLNPKISSKLSIMNTPLSKSILLCKNSMKLVKK